APSTVGLAPAATNFTNRAINDIGIRGGTNATQYAITGTLGGSTLSLSTGGATSSVLVSKAGRVNPQLFPGGIFLTGGGPGNQLRIDNSADTASNDLELTGGFVRGFTPVPIQYPGFGTVAVDLGAGSNTLTGDVAAAGPRQIDVTSAGALTVNQVKTQGASLSVRTTTAAGNVIVGPTPSAATAISTGGGDVLITANNVIGSITVNQTIDTTGGTASTGQVVIGHNVAPATPTSNPPYKGGQNVTPSGNIFLNNTFVGTITVVSGSFQTTPVGAAFGQPLKVLVRNAEGTPAPVGTPVLFTAPGSGASGTFGGSGTHTETVFTGPARVATPSPPANTTARSFP